LVALIYQNVAQIFIVGKHKKDDAVAVNTNMIKARKFKLPLNAIPGRFIEV
jgi:hypothetical protein